MATNIEIKARYPDLQRARHLSSMLQAPHIGTESQLDTYFVVPNGRLKLRESSHNPSILIYYEREDTRDSKQSDYHLVPINDEPTGFEPPLAGCPTCSSG